MMRGRIRKERKGKKEEEGFYGMEENDEEVEPEGIEETSEEVEPEGAEETSKGVEPNGTGETSEEGDPKVTEKASEKVEPKGTVLLSEEEHKRHILALKKIQRKTKWKIFLLDHGEHIYYLFKILLALAALAISFSAMVGQSYTPFLYNQF